MGEVLEHKKASNTIESNLAQMKLGTLEKQVWCFTKSEETPWANVYFNFNCKKRACVCNTLWSSLFESVWQ